MEIFRGDEQWLYTLWLFNIAIENDPFIDDFPIKTTISSGILHGYVSHNQIVAMMLGARLPHDALGMFPIWVSVPLSHLTSEA